jgi:hypothetical protein
VRSKQSKSERVSIEATLPTDHVKWGSQRYLATLLRFNDMTRSAFPQSDVVSPVGVGGNKR